MEPTTTLDPFILANLGTIVGFCFFAFLAAGAVIASTARRCR